MKAARQQVLCDRYPQATVDAIHAAKVARVAAQLRAHPPGTAVSLRKKAAPHQVPKAHDLRVRDTKIDVGALTAILEIDPVRRICVAESGVAFCDLVAATLRHGLVPIVVPELRTITIGGAVSGCSVESMSFRYGGFHDTCLAYEVVTGTGDVLTATPDGSQALLFQMMHGSFGTLGVLTKLTFRLVPARPYVHVVYEHHATQDAYLRAIAQHAEAGDADFVDGMIHAPDHLVLAVGRFVDSAPYTHRYDWMRIYYQSTRTRREDYLRTVDYFFRYDHGVTSVHPSSWLGRLVLGRFAGSRQTLRLADKLRRFLFDDAHPTVTLDVFLPISKVPAFLAWYERAIGHFPLWCVPYRRVRDYEWIDERFYAGMTDRMFVDLAIYGLAQPPGRNLYREIEEQLVELGGIKTLIAHNYYARDEFWSIWNKRNYDRIKAVTDPGNVFRDLYSKTCRAAMGLPG